MIRILIADDSPTDTMVLKHLFELESDMVVVGSAKNGLEALEMVKKHKPDIITMDLNMPVMDGYEATKEIMQRFPTPVVVISSHVVDSHSDIVYKALESGALTVLLKPIDIRSENFVKNKKHFINTIRSMSQVVALRRFSSKKMTANDSVKKDDYEIIAIGSSVGGPQALKEIFSHLAEDFPLPIVVVQHMTQGFIEGFVRWLSNSIKLNVKCAVPKERLKPGVIYFAPDAYHLVVERDKEGLVANLRKMAPVSGFCPSISVLLNSVATTCKSHSVGILLTGMGSDGAQGLLEIKKHQGHTIIQDEESSVVFGMASVAKSLGAVDTELSLNNIAPYLRKLK